MRIDGRLILGTGAALVATLVMAVPAGANPLKLGFADPLYRSSDAETREKWFERTKLTGASIARIDVFWRSTAPTQPLTPTNPNDPAYNWGTLDAAVTDAKAAGLDPLLTVSGAPNWAEGPARPGNVVPGTWKPDADHLGRFAEALAARYAGQVRHYQAWNEPNIFTFLNPQYEGKKLVGPDIYRRMLNAFYEGIHAVQPRAVVVSGGTAPYGDPRGGTRTRPLTFLRALLCLDGRNKPKPCDTKAKLDALAHHPINTSGGPKGSAAHPDDASTADVKHVVEILRKAEQANRIGGGKDRHDLWLTEFWWETNPPDRCTGVPEKRQAKWISQALRSFKQQGARVAINFLVRDQPYDPSECGRGSFQTGVFFANGEKKRSFRALRRASR